MADPARSSAASVLPARVPVAANAGPCPGDDLLRLPAQLHRSEGRGDRVRAPKAGRQRGTDGDSRYVPQDQARCDEDQAVADLHQETHRYDVDSFHGSAPTLDGPQYLCTHTDNFNLNDAAITNVGPIVRHVRTHSHGIPNSPVRHTVLSAHIQTRVTDWINAHRPAPRTGWCRRLGAGSDVVRAPHRRNDPRARSSRRAIRRLLGAQPRRATGGSESVIRSSTFGRSAAD